MIYLDYAAATPVDKKVLAAMEPYWSAEFFNPNASYLAARQVREAFEAARHQLAQTIGARPSEVILTAGATESINLALHGFKHVLVSAIEHAAVLQAAGDAETIKVDPAGRLDLADLQNKLTPKTELISVGYANNEIGVVQDLKAVAEIVQAERRARLECGNPTPLYLHTDASQAAGFLDLNVARLGVDLMTLNAGKCYGPKQVGLLYVRAGVVLPPLILGGGQESGLRSGTENVAGAVGFAAALQLAEKKRKSETKRLTALRDNLEAYLTETFPEAIINGHSKHRLPNLVNFSIPGLDGERAVFALDFAGVAVATGSACSANQGTRSHVLLALGRDAETADGSIRISLGRQTTEAEIVRFKPILQKVIQQELARS